MRNRIVIFGLILLLAGVGVFGWTFVEQRKETQQAQKQQEKLDTSFDKLDKWVAGKTKGHPFTELVSSNDGQQELSRYNSQKERRELALTASIMCMVIGGTVCSWWIFLWVVPFFIAGLSRLAGVFKFRRKSNKPANVRKRQKATEQKSHKKEQDNIKKRSKVLETSGWQNSDEDFADQYEPAVPQTDSSTVEEFGPCDLGEKTIWDEDAPEEVKEDTNMNAAPAAQNCQDFEGTNSPESSEFEESLKTQTENLQKQVEEFKESTESDPSNATEDSELVLSNLNELTQQVSAIREYACQQQGRLEKLQDGYDWNIIKNFHSK